MESAGETSVEGISRGNKNWEGRCKTAVKVKQAGEEHRRRQVVESKTISFQHKTENQLTKNPNQGSNFSIGQKSGGQSEV